MATSEFVCSHDWCGQVVHLHTRPLTRGWRDTVSAAGVGWSSAINHLDCQPETSPCRVSACSPGGSPNSARRLHLDADTRLSFANGQILNRGD